jgi:hypothetical protein
VAAEQSQHHFRLYFLLSGIEFHVDNCYVVHVVLQAPILFKGVAATVPSSSELVSTTGLGQRS